MTKKSSQFNFLLIILLATAVLTFYIFKPFLYTLILALVFAVVFQPLHRRIIILTGKWKDWAPFLTTLVMVIFILTPIIFLLTRILEEARLVYISVTVDGGDDFIFGFFGEAMGRFQKFFPLATEISFDADQYIKQSLGWVLQNIGGIFSNFAKILINLFVFIISFFFILKDGEKLKKIFMALSPLSDADEEVIFRKLAQSVNSVIKGSLIIAMIQGFLSAIGFTVFGVPNAVLWGTAAAISALIPGVGTSLILIPAIIYLLLSGQSFAALGLFLWGALAVSLIDNFLGPRLVSRGMQMHPLIVFISVIGGLSFFGTFGFIFGPLTISLLFALFDIYLRFIKAKNI